jgi:hypothetical protein
MIDSIVVVIDPDVALRVKGEPDREFHLFAARSFGAEFSHVFALFVEDLYSVVAGGGNPDVAIGVNRQAPGFVQTYSPASLNFWTRLLPLSATQSCLWSRRQFPWVL